MKKVIDTGFKWKDLKEVLDGLTEEELEQDAVILRESMDVSGVIHTIVNNEDDLMTDYSDDPCLLRRRKDVEDDYDYEVYIPKNALVAHF